MRCRLSLQKKEAIFCTALVKLQVPYPQAIAVARLLSSDTPDELLSVAERRLIQEVCTYWLQQRKRRTCLDQQVIILLTPPALQPSHSATHSPSSLPAIPSLQLQSR